ncbi:MAG: VWA domain-containing protein [Chloracidobacterium sp.]|nr:VWA domain-containing protein [Chloracidobacterium sp.]
MKMVRSLLFVAFTLIFIPAMYGQSGRRVAPAPISTPPAVSNAKSDAAPRYSESKPQAPRRNRPSVGFPKLGQSGTANPKAGSNDTPVEVGDDEVLKVENNLITIPVSVFDRNGLYIPGLEQEDFAIFENGKEQEIAYFGTIDKPFTVILLIDTSPSTAYKIEEIQAAATAFVDQLKPQDSVMVIEFASNVNVLTEVTNDRQKIYKAIRRANWGDGTSLYDAVDFSLQKRLSKIPGRKAIVLFTDGVATQSSRSGYDSTIDMAEESDAMIFPIYYNTYASNNGGTGSPLPNINGGVLGSRGGIFNPRGQSAADYQRGRQYLNDLAAYTGGRVFRPGDTPGGLRAAFEGIAEELRRQYNIGYVPIAEGKPGQRKDIKVRVDRPNLVVRARDSYIVGATAEPARSN